MKEYSYSDIVKNYANEDAGDLIDENLTEVKDEINDILKVANSRMRNIENSGVASTAYKALVNSVPEERIDMFTKLSVAGLDLRNARDRIVALDTYAKALNYIHNETSTVRGARSFIRKLATNYNKPFDIINAIVDAVTSPELYNGALAFNNYDSERVVDFVSEYLDTYSDDLNSFTDAEQYAEELNRRIEQMMLSASESGADFDIF